MLWSDSCLLLDLIRECLLYVVEPLVHYRTPVVKLCVYTSKVLFVRFFATTYQHAGVVWLRFCNDVAACGCSYTFCAASEN
jgi:hypothetical protein